MKILELAIENYGLYSGTELSFDARGENGLQLIYGANEAGKSTLLQLVRDVLFGFRDRNHPYVFASHGASLAATARIELADGTRLRFRRHKGRKNTVKGEIESSGEVIDAESLAERLGHPNPHLYEQVFAFSLAELASGQACLEEAGVREALFGGALGGLAHLRALQTTLQAEEEALYTARGSKKTINTILKRIEELEGKLRAATVRPAEYERRRVARQELENRIENAHATLRSLRNKGERAGKILRAKPKWDALAELRRELSLLAESEQFPAGGLTELDALKNRHREVRSSIDELALATAEVEAKLPPGDQEESDEALAALLKNESSVANLQHEIGRVREARERLPTLVAAVESHQGEALKTLHSIDPSWTPADLENFAATLVDRARVRELGEEHSELSKLREAVDTRRHDLERQIQLAHQQRAAIEETGGASELYALVDDLSRNEADREQLDRLTGEGHLLSATLEDLEKSVCDGVGIDAERLDEFGVPSHVTVAELRERLQRLETALSESKTQLRVVREQRREREREIAKLDVDERVVNREKLLERRARRDTGWRLIRRRYLRGGQLDWLGEEDAPGLEDVSSEIAQWLADGTGTLPEEFEKELVAVDRIADDLQQRAELIARIDLAQVAVRDVRGREAEAQEAVIEAENNLAAAREEWDALWAELPSPPSSPDAAVDWLSSHARYREKKREHRVHGEQLADLCKRTQRFEKRLRSALDAPEREISELRAEARAKAEAARRSDADRRHLDAQLPQLERTLGELGDEAENVAEREASWQTSWSEVVGRLALPEQTSVRAALDFLEAVEVAQRHLDEARRNEEELGVVRQTLERFETRVAELQSQVFLAPPTEVAEENAAWYAARLAESKAEAAQRAILVRERSEKRRFLEQLQKSAAEVEASIERLLSNAGCQSEAEFRDRGEDAQRARDLQREIDGLERDMSVIRGDLAPDEFADTLKTADPDALTREAAEIDTALTAQESEYKSFLEEAGVQRQLLAELDKEGEALQLAAELESCRGELASAVDRWAPIVLGRALLTRSLDDFERSHRPELLEEVGRIFSTMTLGRYVQVKRRLDESGTLVAVESTGAEKTPRELSTGTREQLYLAIRLGYIRRYASAAEPLPVIMDDVLVNFDDDRALATLGALAEVAGDVQILFLTCHERRVELFRSVASTEPLVLGEQTTQA